MKDPKRQRAGKLSRTKGKTYERLVANQFRELYPAAARGLGQERSGGEVADVRDVPGWWVQCKHHARPDVWAALVQARNEIVVANNSLMVKAGRRPPTTDKPLVVARKNNTEDIAVIALGDFIGLLRELDELRSKAQGVERDIPPTVASSEV